MKAGNLQGLYPVRSWTADIQTLSLTFTNGHSAAAAFNVLRSHMERGFDTSKNLIDPDYSSRYQDLDLGCVLLRQVFVIDLSYDVPAGIIDNQYKMTIKFYRQSDLLPAETKAEAGVDLLAMAKEVH